MMVVISYDVSTEKEAGKKRLRKVAKACEAHAQRVQNSVFEANLDYSTFLKLREELLKIMDKDTDSMRFYYLGNHWQRKIEHVGVKKGYDPEGTIII
jgi:CRISPR-associated protein Cas2